MTIRSKGFGKKSMKGEWCTYLQNTCIEGDCSRCEAYLRRNNWCDLIDKSFVVELHGELHEVMVVRVSPNGTAVQFDFATGSALSDMRWVRADQVTILDTLDGS